MPGGGGGRIQTLSQRTTTINTNDYYPYEDEVILEQGENPGTGRNQQGSRQETQDDGKAHQERLE